MIGFALTMLFGFISKIFPQSLANYLRNSVKKAGEKIKEITSKEKPQLSEEEFSNTSTTIKQLQNEIVETADPVRQEEIREEIAQQERAEEAKYEESEREFTEEGTQAETLESELAELL
ncbi:hypothetical protein [Caldalkalibacillus mannanilyticus]|uniref:hypothetical protein n=1 Tax=Caldalkalibacillus mannanilyticus TaxID=1418 RepID=UPI000468589E|nr:hypothetical protein [Caldalkalibacillus mannanilyticus]